MRAELGTRELEEKKGIAVSSIVAFFIFSVVLSSLMPSFQTTISSFGTIVTPSRWVTGLPYADVYVVHDDIAGNYLTLKGSNTTHVLETNTNPVTAINNAIRKWVPINGKIVTNGTMANWDGTVTPTHGNFTWEAWKTKATQTSSYSTSWLAGVNIIHSFVTINNFTYSGRNSTPEIGIRVQTANHITIENCSITGCYGQGVYSAIFINGGVGHSIRFNNVSFNYRSTMIDFESVSDSVISNNICDCGGNGQCIGVFGYRGAYQSNVNITFNRLSNWGENPDAGMAMHWHGVYTTGTAYCHIYNNTFANSYAAVGGACLIKSYCNYIYNNIFNGQTMDWAFSAYQEPGGGSNWWLSANGTMFSNNKITGYAYGGVWLACTSTYSTGNVTIANNTFVNCGTGIQTDGNAAIHPDNMTFTGNSFTNCNYGIRLGYITPSDWYTSSIRILNNTITNVTYGIAIYSGSTNTSVQYNTFSNCPSPVLDSSASSTFRFNVGLTGYFMLNMSVVGGGTTTPSGNGWQYKANTEVTITWTPTTGNVRENLKIDGVIVTTTSPYTLSVGTTNHVGVATFTGT